MFLVPLPIMLCFADEADSPVTGHFSSLFCVLFSIFLKLSNLTFKYPCSRRVTYPELFRLLQFYCFVFIQDFPVYLELKISNLKIFELSFRKIIFQQALQLWVIKVHDLVCIAAINMIVKVGFSIKT